MHWGLRASAVVVVAGLAVVDPGRFGLPLAGSEDPVATAGPTEQQREAQRVARRYVRALRTGDGELACSAAGTTLRRAATGPCVGDGFEPMAGPTPKVAVPVVRGSRASVGVRRGAAPTLRLQLRREGGRWVVSSVRGR